MTVGIQSGQTITMRHGRFRIAEGLDLSVRIPDAILKCVGYVCESSHVDATGVYGDAYATGFFVAIPCESPELREMRMTYFVTAQHVAKDLSDRPIYFTVNKRDGTVTHEVVIPDAHWWTDPTDPNADVAVVQVGFDAGKVDVIPIAAETMGLADRLNRLNIGIGDEVHAVGLFSAVPGTNRNMPIVRVGNIAMMPTEQIQTELGYTDVYLVEARSIGGMSGSPIFVRPTLRQKVRNQEGELINAFFAGTGETLLGVVQGHWDIREEDINKPSFTHDRKRGVNYGIAVVTPAQKIYEALYSKPLVAMRKEQEQKIIKRTVPGSDRPREKNAAAFTQSDFEAALKKASRKSSSRK